MTRTTNRLPRFRRNAEAFEIINLTPRDKKVIHLVSVFRFLSSAHLLTLLKGGRDNFRRRLQVLYHRGWLDRPRSQIDFYHQGGSRPMVYGLGSRGASLVRREFGTPFSRLSWSGQKGSTGRLFLDHTLMIADILIAVELACGESTGMKFISSGGLESESSGKDAFHWSASVDGMPVGLVPDGVFAVETLDKGGDKSRVICFLEADRGTMPIQRSNRHQSSVSRKLSAYASLWKNGTFEKQFGSKRFAVFLVTVGDERTGKLREAVNGLANGRGLFSCHERKTVLDDPAVILSRCAPRAGSGKI